MKLKDSYNLKPFERLLMFYYVLKNEPIELSEQLQRFRQISGLSEHEAQMAFDECVLRGFVDKR